VWGLVREARFGMFGKRFWMAACIGASVPLSVDAQSPLTRETPYLQSQRMMAKADPQIAPAPPPGPLNLSSPPGSVISAPAVGSPMPGGIVPAIPSGSPVGVPVQRELPPTPV
jgi:hypothetical protein